jgi:hypothetical protein
LVLAKNQPAVRYSSIDRCAARGTVLAPVSSSVIAWWLHHVRSGPEKVKGADIDWPTLCLKLSDVPSNIRLMPDNPLKT